MTDMLNSPGRSFMSALKQLAVAVLVVAIVGGLLFILFIYSGKWLFNFDFAGAADISEMTGPGAKYFIWYTLLAQDVSFFIVPALIMILGFNKVPDRDILGSRDLIVLDFFLAVFLITMSFPLSAFTGELNSKMVLPEWLSGASQWMREKEDTAGDLLQTLLIRDNPPAAAVNILMLAVLPAISEELIFRGVFQRILGRLFGSGHAAVWITSVIFSAVHLQFYGFLPRFILGLLFGYLFLWTRSVWLPVTAHFVNNAVPVIGASFRGWDAINNSAAVAPGRQISLLVFSLIAGSGILFYFYLRSREIAENADPGNSRREG